MKPTVEVVHAASDLSSWMSGVCTEVTKLSSDVSSLLERNLADKSKAGKAVLKGLDEYPRDFLTKNSYAAGAGTFFAVETIEEGVPALDWWARKEHGTIGRLDLDMTPGSSRYYDYEKLPFFSTAASTGEQSVWGPYVDFLGFEEYILTFAAPLSVHGRFTGVAACDIRIRDLEPLIMPTLRAIPGDAALVNASNRVILGNSGLYLVGERIKSGLPGQHRMALDVPHLGLSLIFAV
ncbi:MULTISPECIES: cache domain-containing protein [unclassified Pseudarthrobacter]|uniref:cache domain-containing protein n=1 Tax=unclassified Pseudarthrobacter TaxID=2647000 RepID=UPI001629CE0E|nr:MULTISPECIES: cache domain-containing protein [unclassified Pseudarthrobacter]MBE4718602.1 GntR family transcriptional regulator [Pseudarthrobacter sp. AB1]QNE13140.1 GntR family transcriptional regulator [Pseudarthrobacter sp. NBSH8]